MVPDAARVKSIFLAAVERHPAELWSAYLDGACGHDAELRERVERLLAAHREQPSLHVPPAPRPDETAIRTGGERPGDSVGPYRLLEQIGEGGMGTVYMAEQVEPVRRRVALKIIKPGMDTKQVVARFELERQALALMDHPNIARVLDGGATRSGRPYFVMELVRGVPITEYCDAEELSIPERLGLFVLVCRAVQHAHQKGVIHRDLKPSNVLVTVIDGTAVPKVIDFGVAKAAGPSLTEKTLLTGFAQLIGTPLYMSPEQAQISGVDVDTRSDIYSLGVLLYELMTGTTPFDPEVLKRAAFDEMRRILREDDPPTPSTRLNSLGDTLTEVCSKRRCDPRRLNRIVRGELDWVVMKAMEKDRTRRYETVNGLAADVIRHLTDQPVEACPPSAVYRLTKFARRNRGLLGSLAAVSLVLVLGTLVSTWQAIRATRATRAEAAERRRADAGERQARANLKKAREAVDQMLVRVAERLADVPHMEKVRHDLLADSLKFYEGFLQAQGTDPEVRFETGLAYYQFGKMQVLLGRNREAESAFLQAVRIFGELTEQRPDQRDYRFNLAQSHNELGKIAMADGHLSEAEQAYRMALEICRKLESEFPNDDYRTWVAARLFNLGLLLHRSGRLSEAERTLKESLAIRLRPPQYSNVLWECHIALSALLRDAGRMDEAEQYARQAMDEQQRRVRRLPNSALELGHLRDTHLTLGLILLHSSRPADAEAEFRGGLAISERLVADFPSVPAYRQGLSGDLLNLGVVLGKAGRIAESEEANRKSLAIAEKWVADFPDDLTGRSAIAAALGNLGGTLQDAHRLAEAESSLRKALKISETLAESHAGLLADHIDGLGLVLLEAGRLDEAEALFQRNLAAARAEFERSREVTKHQDSLAMPTGHLGAIQYRRGDWKAALALLENWSELAGESPEEEMPRFFLAMTQWRLGDREKARITFKRAVQRMVIKAPMNSRLGRVWAEAKALLEVLDEPGPPKPAASGKG